MKRPVEQLSIHDLETACAEYMWAQNYSPNTDIRTEARLMCKSIRLELERRNRTDIWDKIFVALPGNTLHKV